MHTCIEANTKIFPYPRRPELQNGSGIIGGYGKLVGRSRVCAAQSRRGSYHHETTGPPRNHFIFIFFPANRTQADEDGDDEENETPSREKRENKERLSAVEFSANTQPDVTASSEKKVHLGGGRVSEPSCFLKGPYQVKLIIHGPYIHK